MKFVIGIVAFALAILVSVALHECGHMWAARATGMKVRRYFVGFGPTLWSTRRGETEYGFKAIPAGGFCDIAGMTAVEELAPDETERAMYKQAPWKRILVLFAGPAMNFVICLVLIYAIALIWGLPNLHPDTRAVVGATGCITPDVRKGEPEPKCYDSPAAAAGIRTGDVVVKVGDTPVSTFDDMAAAIRKSHGTVPVVVQRNGTTLTLDVQVHPTQRNLPTGEGGKKEMSTVGAIGVAPAVEKLTHYNPLTAVPATFTFTGELSVQVGKALAKMPTKLGALVHAIGGGQRDPGTPMSVVGASIIGGDTVDHGMWVAFWFFLAQLNFILGAINLVPLIPFDGGHIAIAVFEKIRNSIRRARGMVAAAPVNYLKLMPATYVVVALLAGFMVLTVTADLVNPIRLFQ